MSTKQLYGQDAQDALLRGAREVYKSVSVTLGARGRNVVRQNFGNPKITNDGVTVARAIDLEDPFERQGADLLKQAAEQTVSEAGDGTTTSIVLAYTLFEKGLELIKGGTNAVELVRSIETEAKKILEKLKEMAIPVKTLEDLENIATISIENKEYGKIVAKAVHTAGSDGLVFVEEGYKPGIHSEEVNGYRFDKGWELPHLVTNLSTMEAVLGGTEGEKIAVLVADKAWNQVEDLLPLVKELKSSGIDKMLLIAEDISGQLLSFFVQNRMELKFHAVIVKPPFNRDMLEDIATLTGATMITASKGIVKVGKEHVGYARKVIVSKKMTTIIDAEGDTEDLIKSLRHRIKDEDDGYEKDKLKERLAKLTGKTVILKVGGETEVEAKYLKDKLDDAVGATQAAVEEGIVPGGGMALRRCAGKDTSPLFWDVLCSPLAKILENAGKVTDGWDFGDKRGFDAWKGEIVPDMIEAGIIDPAKVVRCAFKNAISLACQLLTVEAAIGTFEKNESGGR